MRAVAVALVLIAGAAVVLWFGDTLNSWVLGGLIGGFAALLLSIPISLTLFSYLSRRHDERRQAEAQEEVSLAQMYDYPDGPSRTLRRAYEIDRYAVSAEEEWDAVDAEEHYHQEYTTHHFPVSPSRRLPAANQSRPLNRLPMPQQGNSYPASRSRSASRNLPVEYGNDGPGQRTQSRRLPPASPSYTSGLTRSQLQSEALRAARQEAKRQYDQQDDDIEEFPSHRSQRLPSVRPTHSSSNLSSQPLASQNEQVQRPSRSLSQRPRSPRATNERPLKGDFYHQSFSEEESTDYGSFPSAEAQTDYLDHNYPRTEPIRPPRKTGQMSRHPHLEDQRSDQEFTTGSLGKPLVRRAPYMYQDDPIRQELSQHLDTPVVRRSSRFDARRRDNDEELL